MGVNTYDILDLAKIDAGQLRIEPESVVLATAVPEVLTIIHWPWRSRLTFTSRSILRW